MDRIKYIYILFFCFSVTVSGFELEGNWKLLNADNSKIKIENKKTILYLNGDVHLLHDENEYKADKIVYYEGQNKINFYKNVNLKMKDYKISSSTAKFLIKKEELINKGGVKIEKEDISIKSLISNINYKKSIIKMEKEVFFQKEKYFGISDYFFYNIDDKKIILKKMPYVGFKENYIGGDTIIISLDKDQQINSLEVDKHGDFFWKKNEDKAEINSEKINITFNENDDIKKAIFTGDVRGAFKQGKDKNNFNGEKLIVNFIDGDIKDVIIKGRAEGKGLPFRVVFSHIFRIS